MVQGAHRELETESVRICVLNAFSSLAVWPARGSRQVSKGPRENEGKLGGHRNVWVRHRNFSVWIKYFKFKTESKFISSPASSSAQNAKLYFTLFPTPYLVQFFVIWWLFCCPKYVTALMLWREMISACPWLHCNRTYKNLASFNQSQGTRWL